MNVLAVDPGKAHIGIAYQKACEKVEVITIDNDGDEPRVFENIRRRISDIVHVCKVDITLIEDYAFKMNSRAMSVLGEIKGIIKSCAYQYKSDVIMIPIATWKANVKGIPDKKKEPEAYMRMAVGIYNTSSQINAPELETVDEADALLMLHLYNVCTSTQGGTESMERIRQRIAEIAKRRSCAQ